MLISYILIKNKLLKIVIINIKGSIFILFVLVLIGLIRDNNPNNDIIFNLNRILIYSLLIITFYVTIYDYTIKKNDITEFFYKCIYLPLLFLIILNLFGQIIGIEATYNNSIDLGKSLLFSYFGNDISRISFPFTPGFNNYGVVSGILLIFSITWLLNFEKHKKIVYLGLILSIITIMSVDTRSVIFFSILTLIFSFKNKLSFSKLNWIIPIIPIIGPFFIILPLLFLANFIDFTEVQRTTEDLESFNGRNIIWLFSSLEFIDFKPIHLIGYGNYGHVISGASKSWSNIFGQWGENSVLTTPHSFFYSILFDYGYIGLIIYVIIQYKIIWTIKKYWNKFKSFNKILLNFTLYWNLCGITETIHGFYIPIFLYIVTFVYILIFNISLFSNKFKNTESISI